MRLNIPVSCESVSMMLLLQTHFQSEVMQDVSGCPCGVVGPHDVGQIVGVWPPVLFVQLKRWVQRRGSYLKLSTSFVDFQQITFYGASYEWVAALCHLGNSTEHGHYVTYIPDGEDVILVDDATVSSVDNKYVPPTSVYVVAYSKMRNSLTRLQYVPPKSSEQSPPVPNRTFRIRASGPTGSNALTLLRCSASVV